MRGYQTPGSTLLGHFRKQVPQVRSQVFIGVDRKICLLSMAGQYQGVEKLYRASRNSNPRQVIGQDLLPERLQRQSDLPARAGIAVGSSLAEMEREMIRRTLEHTGGHRKRTAEILGISERDLYYKLRKYELK